MWLAVMSTGLRPSNAAGVRVLVNGANGGLGRLALHLLRTWGGRVTAICAQGTREDCATLGAELAVERGPGCIESLPADYDVVLNFGSWDDDPLLASRLGADASGHATTVHPYSPISIARLAARRAGEPPRLESAIAGRDAPRARYAWTVFKPDREALDALAECSRARDFVAVGRRAVRRCRRSLRACRLGQGRARGAIARLVTPRCKAFPKKG
jgi:hypothetical protein